MMSAYGVTFSLILLLFLANMVKYNEARVAQVSVLFVKKPTLLSQIPLVFLSNWSWFFVGILLIECLFLDLEANGTEAEMVPLMEEGKMEKMMMVMNESRRRLGSFQICALCTCCGGAKGLCLPSPCCYAINCNIPNRPFGFCSFTPKTCNCFGCHLWLSLSLSL